MVVNITGINLTRAMQSVENGLVLQDISGNTTYSWDIASRLTGAISHEDGLFPLHPRYSLGAVENTARRNADSYPQKTQNLVRAR